MSMRNPLALFLAVVSAAMCGDGQSPARHVAPRNEPGFTGEPAKPAAKQN